MATCSTLAFYDPHTVLRVSQSAHLGSASASPPSLCSACCPWRCPATPSRVRLDLLARTCLASECDKLVVVVPLVVVAVLVVLVVVAFMT